MGLMYLLFFCNSDAQPVVRERVKKAIVPTAPASMSRAREVECASRDEDTRDVRLAMRFVEFTRRLLRIDGSVLTHCDDL